MSRLEREQLRGMRLANAGAAMDLFSPTRDLDTLRRLEEIRSASQRTDTEAEMFPVEMRQQLARAVGMEGENSMLPFIQRGRDLNNQRLQQEIEYYPQDIARRNQQQELEQLSVLAEMQRRRQQQQFAVEDRGLQEAEREERKRLADLAMRADLLKTASDVLGPQQGLSVPLNELLTQYGLPAIDTMTPEQRQAMALFAKLKPSSTNE